MKQPGKLSFVATAQRFGEASGESRHVAKVLVERLPCRLRQGFAVRVVGGMGVVIHGVALPSSRAKKLGKLGTRMG